MSSVGERTIDDFGAQWQRYRANESYYASLDVFADIVEPLVPRTAFQGKRVADIGSGSGRIVNMLAEAGAASILAVEPSAAAEVLRENTRQLDNVEILHAPGDQLPPGLDLDYVVSFGVIHHIPEPDPVMRAIYAALRPGGKAVIWLYGHEGNELYLSLAEPARMLTCRMPDPLLAGLSWSLTPPLSLYARASKLLPLPMRGYMQDHILKLSPSARMLTIYDQLNPRYAKYYRRQEAIELLTRAGFSDVQIHHRHGYSWTVVGTRPEAEGPPAS
ncbi:MAG: class I SAM-dependent methyltransferase [Planctomycetes bacterium]|nr:class I SAM-dependent methyltransferase [Planctomycetota bacterium]